MLIDYHSANEKLGSGRRLCIVYNRRGKTATFLDCFNFQRVRLPVDELRHTHPHGLTPYRMRSLAVRMDERRKLFKRLGVRFDEKAVRAAIDALRDDAAAPTDQGET